MAEVVLVAGLGFGDEGKGSVVDFLTRTYSAKLVFRYNGGAQAAHNVLLDDGRHHTFSQFGSGTLLPWCRTHLSRYMLVQPAAMLSEEKHLQTLGIHDAFERTTIEGAALITTRFHGAVNRLREMHRAAGRHGSCGLGIGETVVDSLSLSGDALFAADMLNPKVLREKLRKLQEINRAKVEALDSHGNPNWDDEWQWLVDPLRLEAEAAACEALARRVEIVDPSWFERELRTPGLIIGEGAQGILLDQFRGFMPYCTRSTITFDNAMQLVRDLAPVKRLGVIRSYMTRHGAGPMPTEEPELKRSRQELHNCWGPWQQNFRLGELDMVLLRYAVEAAGVVDAVALTHMDQPSDTVCWRYEPDSGPLKLAQNLDEQFGLARVLAAARPVYSPISDHAGAIESVAGAPVTLISNGPKPSDKAVRCRMVGHA